MMRFVAQRADPRSPALTRLQALGPLDREATALLDAAIGRAVPVRARAELCREGRRIGPPRLIVSGWAARVRLMLDGRRQFLSFLLPGDVVGVCRQPRPVAASSIVALTDLMVADLPEPSRNQSLDDAYATSTALEEAYLLANITRLGRLHAQERIADLLLELHERLALVGLAAEGQFDVPLTQEMLGDALGLTSVHVNRMLQQSRRAGDLAWRDGHVVLTDPVALARAVGRSPARVTELPD